MQSLFKWVGRAVGLDLHRDFCEVAICEDGVVRSAGRVATTPEALETLAASLVPRDRVAMEVSGGAWEVARILEPHVNRVIVVSPDDTGIAQARTKTDRLDAGTLASLLWKGELEAVWMPDERARVLRRRLARREQLVRTRTRVKNEVHAVLMRRLKGSACQEEGRTGTWRSLRGTVPGSAREARGPTPPRRERLALGARDNLARVVSGAPVEPSPGSAGGGTARGRDADVSRRSIPPGTSSPGDLLLVAACVIEAVGGPRRGGGRVAR